MARTYATVISRARDLVQDTVAPYRYSDAALYAALDTVMLEFRRLRPDLFLGSLLTDLVQITSDASATTFPLPPHFIPPVVSYIAGYMELREDEYSNDGRAAALMSRFTAQVMGIA